jgi:signal-transduction protein with cAMP-binding, CBS, and nucleotidyltransferase domain
VARPGETAREAASRMREAGVGTLIVLDEGDRPIGIVTDRDLMVQVVAEGRAPAKTLLSSFMSAPVHTVREDAPIEDALALMARRGIRRLPVVAASEERLIGVLALDDVLELLAEETATIGRLLAKRAGPRGDRPQAARAPGQRGTARAPAAPAPASKRTGSRSGPRKA